MEKFTAADVANGYFEHRLAFKGLEAYSDEEEENLLAIEHAYKKTALLSSQELIDDYSISSEVADKLIRYQTALLASYRDTVADFLGQVDRYMEVKPYLNNQTLNKTILTQYVMSDWDYNRMLKEFRPVPPLRNGFIGTLLSYSIFVLTVSIGWNTHPPSGFDFISLGIVSFIWLGLTTAAAWQLPSKYRARKIVYHILNMHSEDGHKTS